MRLFILRAACTPERKNHVRAPPKPACAYTCERHSLFFLCSARLPEKCVGWLNYRRLGRGCTPPTPLPNSMLDFLITEGGPRCHRVEFILLESRRELGFGWEQFRTSRAARARRNKIIGTSYYPPIREICSIPCTYYPRIKEILASLTGYQLYPVTGWSYLVRLDPFSHQLGLASIAQDRNSACNWQAFTNRSA